MRLPSQRRRVGALPRPCIPKWLVGTQSPWDSFLLATDIKGHPQPVRSAWLPRRDTIRESVALGDAVDEAKEIFSNWVGKVRRSIPDSIPAAGLSKEPSSLAHKCISARQSVSPGG